MLKDLKIHKRFCLLVLAKSQRFLKKVILKLALEIWLTVKCQFAKLMINSTSSKKTSRWLDNLEN